MRVHKVRCLYENLSDRQARSEKARNHRTRNFKELQEIANLTAARIPLGTVLESSKEKRLK